MLAYPGMEDAITLFMPEEQNPYSTIIMDYITSCELQESPDAKVYYEAIVMAVNEGIDILIHIRVCVCVCVGGGGGYGWVLGSWSMGRWFKYCHLQMNIVYVIFFLCFPPPPPVHLAVNGYLA